MPTPSPSPALSDGSVRQTKLLGKLVDTIVRQTMLKQPAVGMSQEEVAFITDAVRKQVFSGKPLTEKDMARIANKVVASRTPPQSSASSAAPPRPAAGTPVPSTAATRSTASRSSAAPSLPQLPPRSRTPSCASEASVASTGSVARMSVGSVSRTSSKGAGLTIQDMKTIEQLNRVVSTEPDVAGYTGVLAKSPARLKADPWLSKALENKRDFEEAQRLKRERQRRQMEEQKRVLEEQMALKRAATERAKLDDVAEAQERVAMAQQSLAEEDERRKEQRHEMEERRRELAEMQRQAISQKRSKRLAQHAEEREVVDEALKEHAESAEKEQVLRRAEMQRIRDVLKAEALRKQDLVTQRRREKLEFELELLEDAQRREDAERVAVEASRAKRIALAKASHDETRRSDQIRKEQERAFKEAQDRLTIDGDRSFIEREKREAEDKKKRNRTTQQALKHQMLERQLHAAIAKEDDVPYVERARIDAIEQEADDLMRKQERREQQAEFRQFLDLQSKARRVRLVHDVETSISHPRAPSLPG